MTVKVEIKKDGTAFFTCPECHYSKKKDVSAYKKTKTAVRLTCRCKCGNNYSVLLERRRHFRKKTNLSGSYTNENGDKVPIIINNLSISGISFQLDDKHNKRMLEGNGFKVEIPVDTERNIAINIGDKLMVEFYLDDREKSWVQRDVTVKYIKGDQVGGEFGSEGYYERLGGYLII